MKIKAKDNLKYIIKAMLINYGDFADKVKISRGYLSLIINQKASASPKVAKKICKTTKHNFDDIFEIGEE